MNELQNKFEAVIWSAHALFYKGLVGGSTGNVSFRENNQIYISESGSCFGRLNQDNFAVLDIQGHILKGTPSKEYPMHLAMYQANKNTQAVLHTHSFYATAFSCLKHTERHIKQLFSYTPYLKMITKGSIECVEYALPGSEHLFQNFKEKTNEQTNLYILKNHGVFVSAKDVYSTVNVIEEFETSARIFSELRKYSLEDINLIE